MADISASFLKKPADFEFQSPIEWRRYDLNTAVYTTVLTAATHNLIAIPVGQALLGGYGVVYTSFASAGGNATVRFHVGSDYFGAAIPQANLAAGDVVPLGNVMGYTLTQSAVTDSTGGTAATTLVAQTDAAETGDRSKVDDNFASVAARLAEIKADVASLNAGSKASIGSYAKSAADTFDWTIGTEAVTAGRILLWLAFIDVNKHVSTGLY